MKPFSYWWEVRRGQKEHDMNKEELRVLVLYASPKVPEWAHRSHSSDDQKAVHEKMFSITNYPLCCSVAKFMFVDCMITAHQAFLSSDCSRSLLKCISIESVMLSNNLLPASPFAFNHSQQHFFFSQ